ncbi:MAG: Mrp/NBP35 family ATP-binding protein [Eubacteriales bacterium]|nr:Mrp/NBP35 family ATP-binding protein [Eubacteriales bacterium]
MSNENTPKSNTGKVPPPQPNFKAEANAGSRVKKMIAVVSGKGGVGKSSVTAMSALWAARQGFSVGIMDADITGPSIPRMFGVGPYDLSANETTIFPATSVTGIKVMSMNLLMEKEDTPVIWRSPVITGALKQFWTDVAWGDVDYLFVDMPPGTGDIPLTVFQSLPVDGLLIVTTPQDLVSMIVRKAVGMAKMMNVPILGIIENMSYVKCPHCGEELRIFGNGHVDETAKAEGIPVVARIPIDAAMTAACDTGKIEYYDGDFMGGLAQVLPGV